MPSSREIKRKIKSIRSTRQITRAMELVAAAKMKKAVHAAISMRTYASTALLLLTQLAEKAPESQNLLLMKRPVRKVLMVVFSSDRGLCGGFNTMLFKKLLEVERGFTTDGASVEYLAVGKKVQNFLARTGRRLQLAFPAMTISPKLIDTLPIGKYLIDAYKAADCDEVTVLYQHFVSPLTQKPTAYQLLPFSQKVLEEMNEHLQLFKHLKRAAPLAASGSSQQAGHFGLQQAAQEYLFEPSAEAILGNLLPQLTQMQVFQAAQETTASEHSARMLAMRNATDNASEFIRDLTLHLNQVRQATITREIAEISAGKVALEG